MALKGFEGFDRQASATDLMARIGTLTFGGRTTSGNISFVSPGRTGAGRAIRLFSQGFTQATLAGVMDAAHATVHAGCGVFGYPDHDYDATGAQITFWDYAAGAAQAYVKFSAVDGSVKGYRGDGTLLGASANGLFPYNTWSHIEAGATIHPSAGVLAAKVNGQSVLNLTGINTRNTANSSAGGADIASILATGGAKIDADDFYVTDGSTGPGPYPMSGFLGDVRSIPLRPTGNDAVAWTPLAGDNWQEVAETLFDGDGSYNFTNTPDDEDSFVFEALAGTISQIIAVQLSGAYRKNDATTRTLKQRLTSNVTTADGATVSLPTTYGQISDIFALDPDGDIAWTSTAINALKGAYRLVA